MDREPEVGLSNPEANDVSRKLRMKPAVSRLFCCSVTAASGFIAAYALVWYESEHVKEPVAYAIALIYEIIWVVESGSRLPIPAALLMLCYAIVIAATVTLVHGLISKNNRCLMAWLMAVILVLIPECALVFYMAISHWGLQGVYGGAELASYVARLPAVVIGVVLVQSAYALREQRVAEMKPGYGEAAVPSSEFDASHYVPDAPAAFINDGFMADNGKPGSMPDLRRHLAARQSQHFATPYPMMVHPPPNYWQHYADRQYAASLRGLPKAYPTPQTYGTWMGPRADYKRRHSVVGTFEDYPKEYEDRMDCKSEYYYDPRQRYNYERSYPPEYDPRFVHDYKSDYGVNLLRHEPHYFRSPRDRYYDSQMRDSHNSVGTNVSDDFTKYKDVAL